MRELALTRQMEIVQARHPEAERSRARSAGHCARSSSFNGRTA